MSPSDRKKKKSTETTVEKMKYNINAMNLNPKISE